MRYDGWVYKTPQHKCRDCNKRHPACHDTCEDYIKTRAEYLEKKQAAKKAKILQKQITSYEVEQRLKVKRKKNI